MWRRLGAGVAAASLVLAGLAATAPASAGSAAPRPAYRTTVFKTGAAIHGANGLAIDRQGHLLVASAMGAQIDVVDRASGRVLKRWGRGAGVDSPDDVAVGPDGSVYWTDLPAGQVGRRTPSGKVTKQFVAPGVNPIAFAPDGKLYVAQAFRGDGLYQLDPALKAAPRVVIPNSGTAPFPNQLNGFDVAADGSIYAPQPFLRRIVRIDPATGQLTEVVGGLPDLPTSVELDARGRLFASLYTGTVVRVDPTAHTFTSYARIRGATLDNMVFGPRHQLYVSNSASGALYVVPARDRVRTLTRGGLILPGGLAVQPRALGKRSLFVSDVWRVLQYDVGTGRLLSVDHNSPAPGSVTDSWSLRPFLDNVVLTSWFSNTVQIWNPVTHSADASWTDFDVPVSAARYHGSLVVAQYGNGTVVRLDGDGSRTTLVSGLKAPAGLLAGRDNLYVSDWATGRIWLLARGGVPLPRPKLVARRLSHPEGMSMDGHGRLLVVETGAGRLTRVDPRTGRVRALATGLRTGLRGSAYAPAPWAVSGVAVAPSGAIFVSGDRTNVIYKIVRR